MKKFYVYHVKKNADKAVRTHAFVSEDRTDAFALQFNPKTMTFTGVMVEAESPEEASKIYESPHTHGGEIYITDEPRETKEKADAFKISRTLESDKLKGLKRLLDDILAKGSMINSKLLAKKLADQLVETNKTMSELARQVRACSKEDPERTVEKLYDRVKKQYINQLINDLDYEDENS